MSSSNDQPAGQAPSSPTDKFHRPILQSMPDTRQQSFDEIYGPPENFLEIEVPPTLCQPFRQHKHTMNRKITEKRWRERVRC